MNKVSACQLFEICGVAGAGKSTTFKGLKSELSDVLFGFRLDLKSSWRQILIASIKSIIPILGSGFSGSFIVRCKCIIYLEAMYLILNGDGDLATSRRIVDQGPVYLQAHLLTSVRGYKPTVAMVDWVDRKTVCWVKKMKGLIWLEVDIDTLTKRVNDRSEGHFIKRNDPEVASAFIEEYMKSYEHLLHQYLELGVPVMRINTVENGVNQVVEHTKFFLAQK